MIRIFSYSRTANRMETPGIAELPQHLQDADRVIWVDLEDPDDEEMGVLGGIFGFHVLAAEDCIQGGYLPMLDVYDTYAFFVLHAIDVSEMEDHLQTIEVGCFLGERFLVTHHPKQVKGIFDARGKVAQNPGALLNAPDWLLHNIVDAMTDQYIPAIEALNNRIGNTNATPEALERRHIEVARLLQIGQLQQTVLTQLAQSDFPYISNDHQVYYQNIKTHMIRTVQLAQSSADALEAHQAASLIQANNAQAQNIRTLIALTTPFATAIFLTVLFDPELQDVVDLSDKNWAVLTTILTLLISGGVAGFLKFKKWF